MEGTPMRIVRRRRGRSFHEEDVVVGEEVDEVEADDVGLTVLFVDPPFLPSCLNFVEEVIVVLLALWVGCGLVCGSGMVDEMRGGMWRCGRKERGC